MKKFISLILSFCMIMSLAVSANAIELNETDFNDIANHENAEAIDTLATLNIIGGYPDGGYHPDNSLTRAQAATLMVRALYGENGIVLESLNWKDVPVNYWARKYIDTAYMYSIMGGYGDGVFGPEDNVTYVQMATIVLNTLGYSSNKLQGTWPAKEINQANALDLFDGLTIKDYNDACTRGAAAQIIFNAFDDNCVTWNGAAFIDQHYNFLSALGYEETDPTLITTGENCGHVVVTYIDETNNKLITNVIASEEETAKVVDGHWTLNNKPITLTGIHRFYNGKAVNSFDSVENGDTATAIIYNDKVVGLVIWESETYYPGDGKNYGDMNTEKIRDFIPGISTVTVWNNTQYLVSNKISFGSVVTYLTTSTPTGAATVTLKLSNGDTIVYDVDDIEVGDYVIFFYDTNDEIVGYHELTTTISE